MIGLGTRAREFFIRAEEWRAWGEDRSASAPPGDLLHTDYLHVAGWLSSQAAELEDARMRIDEVVTRQSVLLVDLQAEVEQLRAELKLRAELAESRGERVPA